MAKIAKHKGEAQSMLECALCSQDSLTSVDNPRSRAARRATSPSLNTDKSIKEAPRATDATPVLAPYHGAGIHKKIKNKRLSRAQRVRHSRGMQRGQEVQDQLQAKVADAKSRLRQRQGRRALWEDINSTSNEEVRKAIKAPGRFDSLDDEDEDLKDNIQPFHGDTEIKVIDGIQVPTFATGESLSLTMGPASIANSKKPGTFGLNTTKPEEPLDEIT